jgi:chitin disaccharide deacetylase
LTRRLVVNADDFGFTRDVNEGIVAAHQRGILTATTLMANGGAFEHAVELASANPGMDVGCHLVLVGGKSLLRAGQDLPIDVPSLLRALALRRISPYDELRAQVERIVAAGIRPTHLDTHKHTHLAFPVLDAVARLSEEFGIRWVRRPFDFPLSGGAPTPFGKRMLSGSLHMLRSVFHRKLSARGCCTTDYFAGFQLTGYLRVEELVALIRVLPEGVTEFMCHPGFCTDELRCSRTRLKESRERELEALVSPEVQVALREAGVQLVRYRDL